MFCCLWNHPQLKKFKFISKILGNRLKIFLLSNSNALGAVVVVVVVVLVVVIFTVVVGINLTVVKTTLVEVVVEEIMVVVESAVLIRCWLSVLAVGPSCINSPDMAGTFKLISVFADFNNPLIDSVLSNEDANLLFAIFTFLLKLPFMFELFLVLLEIRGIFHVILL